MESECKTLDLGDPRRVRRWKQIAAGFLAQPGASLPRASGDWAGTKAACRLFVNEAMNPAAVAGALSAVEGLAAHREAALERARGQAVVLAVQDTTTLNFQHASAHARAGAHQ